MEFKHRKCAILKEEGQNWRQQGRTLEGNQGRIVCFRSGFNKHVEEWLLRKFSQKDTKPLEKAWGTYFVSNFENYGNAL